MSNTTPIERDTLEGYSYFMEQHRLMVEKLARVASYTDDEVIYTKAHNALIANTAVMHRMLEYILEPPSFSWHFVRSPILDAEGNDFFGLELWSLHS